MSEYLCSKIYNVITRFILWNVDTLRFISTLWPILQLIAHHIQDKLAVSFDSSSIGLISYKWFLTIDAKYSSVKAYNEENSIFLEKNIPFQNISNPQSACIFWHYPLSWYMRGVQIITSSFLSHTKSSNHEMSYHVLINVRLIISTLIAGSRFTGGQ